MRIKKSYKKSYLFITCLAFITLALVSVKLLSKEQKNNKYPSVPEFVQKTELEVIQITINEKYYKKIKKKRAAALNIGVLETSTSDYVPATIGYKGKEYRAEIRLKGDWTDHLTGEKWSFRVKLKGDKTIRGMRKFSLHHPKTRGYVNEWLYHKVMKGEGITGLRYGFVEGRLHIKSENSLYYSNKELGIYAIEETFDKRTIESNQRKESIILKFSEEYWWNEVKKSNAIGKPYGYLWNKFMNGSMMTRAKHTITVFSENKVLADSTFHKYFKYSKNSLEDLRTGKATLDQVFDIKELAKYTAILNLFGAVHGSYIINLRFYYNPITTKLEPIAFDGNSGNKIEKFCHFMFTKQKKDTAYLVELVKAIREVSSPVYLENLIEKNEKELRYLDTVLKKEFGKESFKKANFDHNQQMMIKELSKIEEQIRINLEKQSKEQ